MPKSAISVTLRDENLTWLRGRVRAEGARSVSDALDRLVTEARVRRTGTETRSVVGTITVDPADPRLLGADEAIQALVASSLGRPMVVKEAPAPYGVTPRRKRSRRG
jgi:hypothetical protein